MGIFIQALLWILFFGQVMIIEFFMEEDLFSNDTNSENKNKSTDQKWPEQARIKISTCHLIILFLNESTDS